MVLARSEKSLQHYYSMSAQIRLERNDYYSALEWTQEGGLNVMRWQTWFLECLQRAIVRAEEMLGAVLAKARFWERVAKEPLNR